MREIIVPIILFITSLFFFFDLKKDSSHTVDKITEEDLSQYLGYTFWQDVKYYQDRYGFKGVTLDAVIRGMKACERSEALSLKMSAQDERQMISDLQKELYEKTCFVNRQRAEEFLSKVAQKPSICTVVDQQLYYEVLQEGHGTAQVTSTSTSLFHYTIKTVEDIEIVNTRRCEKPRKICLAEVIPGLAQGVTGMREGERRKLYIHPDLSYRKLDWKVPPETALIVDVALYEVNLPQ